MTYDVQTGRARGWVCGAPMTTVTVCAKVLDWLSSATTHLGLHLSAAEADGLLYTHQRWTDV